MVKIFIGNLAADEESTVITEKHIKPLFDTYGTVTECTVFSLTKGYGFVHMPNVKEAKRAIRDLDGWRVGGRRINVELSTEHGGGTKIAGGKSAQSAISKASAGPKNNNPVTLVQDCYFFQNASCGRKSQCPYLHRVLPDTICKLHLFKKCKKSKSCELQHLTFSSLPDPLDSEFSRVKMVARKKEENRLRESTGAIRKINKVAPSISETAHFQCLDCGFTATSCFLLETHLNTEEHWERVKQVKREGEELRGVVGDREDVLCEVCAVRVNRGKMEEHKREALHMSMVKRGGRHKDVAFEREEEDIHVCDIPQEMSCSTFKQICQQFGQVTKLKFLPAGRHAYVRYATEEAMEFAAIKLRGLQKSYFARASDQLIGTIESEDEDNKGNVAKVAVFRNGHHGTGYACDLCEAVCNSLKQHKLHARSHKIKGLNEENLAVAEVFDQFRERNKNSNFNSVIEADKSNTACVNSSSPVSPIFDDDFHQLLLLSQLNYQLEQATIAREEQEAKLIICQNQMRICKEFSGDIFQTLNLLQEELEIQKKLRDLEEDLYIKKIQLNNLSSPKTRTVGSRYLAVDSVSQEQLLSQLARFGIQDELEPDGDPLVNSLSESVYHPDDVFNSDDSFEC